MADSPPPDARPIPPDAIIDVLLADAIPDAIPPPDADEHLNPLGIKLVDVSLDAVGEWLMGGSTNIDPWDMGSGAA